MLKLEGVSSEKELMEFINSLNPWECLTMIFRLYSIGVKKMATNHKNLADALANNEQWEKTVKEIHDDKLKYWVCCPLCDNPKCVRGTKDCDAEKWKKMKLKEAREWRNCMAGRKWGDPNG